jgi:hypothetical protein
VLDVQRGDDVDAGVEQPVDVVPALVPRGELVGLFAADDGVRQLVDQRVFGFGGDDRVDVKFAVRVAVVGHFAGGHHRQPVDETFRAFATVVLHQPDDDRVPARVQVVALVEHRAGLADARREPEIDLQFSALRHAVSTCITAIVAPAAGPARPARSPVRH